MPNTPKRVTRIGNGVTVVTTVTRKFKRCRWRDLQKQDLCSFRGVGKCGRAE